MDTNENIDSNMRLKGKPSAWPKILLALVLIALAVWFVVTQVLNKDVSTQDVQNTAGGAANTARQALNNFSSFLASQKKSDFQGVAAEFSNLTVKSVGVDDRVFWVNNAGAIDPSQNVGRDLLVHMSSELQARVHQDTPPLTNGMRVNVSGTLKQAPSVEDMKSQWQLNDDDANYVASGDNMYLEASSVQAIR